MLYFLYDIVKFIRSYLIMYDQLVDEFMYIQVLCVISLYCIEGNVIRKKDLFDLLCVNESEKKFKSNQMLKYLFYLIL